MEILKELDFIEIQDGRFLNGYSVNAKIVKEGEKDYVLQLKIPFSGITGPEFVLNQLSEMKASKTEIAHSKKP